MWVCQSRSIFSLTGTPAYFIIGKRQEPAQRLFTLCMQAFVVWLLFILNWFIIDHTTDYSATKWFNLIVYAQLNIFNATFCTNVGYLTHFYALFNLEILEGLVIALPPFLVLDILAFNLCLLAVHLELIPTHLAWTGVNFTQIGVCLSWSAIGQHLHYPKCRFSTHAR